MSEHDGPLPALLQPIARPMSRVYGWAVDRRNTLFDRGHRVTRFEAPVISVGNMTTGGTGKTPIVTWLAKELLKLGVRPVIAMRGYARKAGERSDEEAEYAARFPQGEVDVLAQPNRVNALRMHLAGHADARCVLLDDGFQHRFVARDLDLVLIDATRRTMRDALLPMGTLREPLDALRRADAVIVTRAEREDDALAQEIAKHHGRPPIAWTQHGWSGVTMLRRGQAPDPRPIDSLRGMRLITMFGVGNPEAIRAQAALHGAVIVYTLPVRDHQRYDPSHLRTLQRLLVEHDAQAVLTTMKDWVKVSPLEKRSGMEAPFIVPMLSMRFLAGRDALLERVRAVMEAPHPPRDRPAQFGAMNAGS